MNSSVEICNVWYISEIYGNECMCDKRLNFRILDLLSRSYSILLDYVLRYYWAIILHRHIIENWNYFLVVQNNTGLTGHTEKLTEVAQKIDANLGFSNLTLLIYLGKSLSRSKYRLERIKIINSLMHRINRSVYEYEVMCGGKLVSW